MKIPELLIASHIIPWKDRKETRVNPKNGICLNVFHDKAFDRGFITITTDFTIKVSNLIYDNYDKETTVWFKQYDNSKIILPERFIPNLEFLKYHNDVIFESFNK